MRTTLSLDQPVKQGDSLQSLGDFIEGAQGNVGDLMASQEIITFLKRAILMLKEEDRQVVVFCAIEKMPHKEVAEILGWPTEKVTLHLHRAKQRLLEIIKQLQGTS